MQQMLRFAVVLIPAFFVCFYVYQKDRADKEPLGLLLWLFGCGAVLYFPVFFAKKFVIHTADRLFAEQISYHISGVAVFVNEGWHALHTAFCTFLLSLVQEGLKFSVLFFLTSKNRHFSHLFDGVIYAVFLSMGFVILENITFAVRDGWDTLVLRLAASLPSHLTFGVLMGVFYTVWNVFHLAAKEEKRLCEKGILLINKPFISWTWLLSAFICPGLLHGFCDFFNELSRDVWLYVFYAFVSLLLVFSVIFIHRISLTDMEENSASRALLLRKYPACSPEVFHFTDEKGREAKEEQE